MTTTITESFSIRKITVVAGEVGPQSGRTCDRNPSLQGDGKLGELSHACRILTLHQSWQNLLPPVMKWHGKSITSTASPGKTSCQRCAHGQCGRKIAPTVLHLQQYTSIRMCHRRRGDSADWSGRSSLCLASVVLVAANLAGTRLLSRSAGITSSRGSLIGGRYLVLGRGVKQIGGATITNCKGKGQPGRILPHATLTALVRVQKQLNTSRSDPVVSYSLFRNLQ